jgi:hypothetical protein
VQVIVKAVSRGVRALGCLRHKPALMARPTQRQAAGSGLPLQLTPHLADTQRGGQHPVAVARAAPEVTMNHLEAPGLAALWRSHCLTVRASVPHVVNKRSCQQRCCHASSLTLPVGSAWSAYHLFYVNPTHCYST